MRRALVAANWKMNASVAAIDAFVRTWQRPSSDVEVVFCPPFGYVDRLVAAFAGEVHLGVQDVGVEAKGAFTGEHSAEMAADLGAAYCIVGHSERRALHGEDDAVVAGKFRAALRAGLTPVLCVGETLAERRAGDAKETVLRQLDAVLNDSGAAPFADAAVAYEPVWAIGTGVTASPEQAAEMHGTIRQRLAAEDADAAAAVRIVYGGSVKAANAATLFAQVDIDGGLVGGASLDPNEFAAICAAAAEVGQ
ncbi:MAG: triose-phosphate isomerase [Gammaproteobacteria bacterium]|nr:triose-phosphate isomerase [Gammaproteobacteria bacterium]MYB37259.1 triose-phosphate isomerase [Gammaproteobacteria bacterium]